MLFTVVGRLFHLMLRFFLLKKDTLTIFTGKNRQYRLNG
jgi:hypothetical protein